MATFWLVAWGLIFVAICFALLPLLRGARSQAGPAADRINLTVFQDQLAELEADVESGILSADQLEEGRLELQRRLLEETNPEGGEQAAGARSSRPILAIVVGLALPITTILLYLQLGRVDLLTATAPEATAAADPMSSAQLRGVVEGLAKRLEAEPNDPRGWMMLGRSYNQFGEHQKAADAFARALELVGDHPDILAAYADALAMANGGRFGETSIDLVSRALEIEPNHPQAVWLAGTIAYRRGDYAKALELWERLAAQAPEGSEMARAVAANIAEARALLGGGNPKRSSVSEGLE